MTARNPPPSDLQPSVESRTVLERVQNHSLPARLTGVVESYDDVVGDRDRFLWQWAHHLFPAFRLSCVDPEHAETTRDIKLYGLMFVSILDDIAEKHDDRATFEEATNIPFDHRSVNLNRDGIDREALELATEIWNRFSTRVREGPRATEFDEILQFDLTQILNAMEYSYFANQNLEFITESEVQTYDAHNMMLYGFADVDLAYSPRFDRYELSSLRRVIERAQRMVRIGNWITTWERELGEGDFASGVVAHALEHDVVSVDDLRALQERGEKEDVDAIVETIRDHAVEDVFFHQWHEELALARELERAVHSVDLEAYLDGIERVMEYHLASRGLK